MLEELKKALYKTTTENGALTNTTSHSYLLDFFSLAGAMRNRKEADITSLFSKAFNENPDYAMKALFFMRDIREGNGERRLFRICTKWLAENETKALVKNLPYFAHFGRWDDLNELLETKVYHDVIKLIIRQIEEDILLCEINQSISLLAKWLPSENASSTKTKKQAQLIMKGLGYTPKLYRKTLSRLRKHIDVLERKMSERKWDEIDYEAVPSQAMMKYRQAFYRNDEERYEAYVNALHDESPVTRASINVATLHPYQIVEKVLYARYSQEKTQLYDAMWNNLPDVVGDKYQNSLAVVDVSGSMSGTPLFVAISLGLYIAEKNKGRFHNHFMTFSSRPELVEVVGSNFTDKVQNIATANWGMNTNLEASFKLILDTAVKHKLSPSELPSSLIIISDMEFDMACRNNSQTLFDTLKESFEKHGYKLPRVVFWNVDARQNQAPVVKDEPNVQLISGFSQNLFASLMEQREYSPYDFMMEVLAADRYKDIVA